MRPRSGVMMPAMHLRVTLLPQPEAPSRAMVPWPVSNFERRVKLPSFFSISTIRLTGSASFHGLPR